ncbi:MAG: DUF167 domain-containing protein [Pseudomonadota bacterium]
MKFFMPTVLGEIGFYVQATPNAGQTRVIGMSEYQGHLTLKVALATQPVDNKANNALVRYLADYFDLPKNSVSLLKGHTCRLKLVSFCLEEAALTRKFKEKGWIIVR